MIRFRICLAFAALANLVIPCRNSCAQQNDVLTRQEGSRVAAARDIALGVDGVLKGHFESDRPQSVDGKLIAPNGKIIRFRTDAAGSFEVAGVGGGAYRLVVGKQDTSLRLWKHGTAPPTAQPILDLRDGNPVHRGQQPLSCFLPSGETILIGLLLAAAIAIPIAVHNSGDDANGS